MLLFHHTITPAHLAILGCLDPYQDTYDALCYLQDVAYQNTGHDLNNVGRPVIDFNKEWFYEGGWRESSYLEDSRKRCEDLINSQLAIFTDHVQSVHLSTTTMENFSMFAASDPNLISIGYYYKPMFISLPAFLEMILDLVVRAIGEETSSDYDSIHTEVVGHIQALVEDRLKVWPASKQPEFKTISVYNRITSTKCYLGYHEIVRKDLEVDLTDGSGSVVLPTQYCKDCGQFLIQKETPWLCERRYGKLAVVTKPAVEDLVPYKPAARSPLHDLDDAIFAAELTKSQQREYLIGLLETRSVTYQELCEVIEQFIYGKKPTVIHESIGKIWKKHFDFILQWAVENEYPQ